MEKTLFFRENLPMDTTLKPALLTGNTLKIIAAISMVIDHVGLLFFPRVKLLRILGRLAFPIFAFMIAEGCKYTKNRLRYFGTIFCLAAGCQVVYYLFDGSVYMSILAAFSLSIPTIYALQNWKCRRTLPSALLFAGTVAAVYALNRMLTIDYGFWGCMVPVFASVFQNTKYDRIPLHVAMLGLGLIFLAAASGGIQWYALLALPLLLLYSGKRGKRQMKYFFYIFYPAHLAVLQGLQILLEFF